MTSIYEAGPKFKNRREFLAYALEAAGPGHIAEFGVYNGDSMRLLCELAPGSTIHGFDCLEGLPEYWRSGWGKGCLKANGPPELPKNGILHVGLFQETLEGWLEAYSGPMGLIHIDCDLFSSTKYVIATLRQRIVPGTVVAFDEFLIGGYLGDEGHAWLTFGIPSEFVCQMGQNRVVLRVTG